MADVNASLDSADANRNQSLEPIRLPNEPTSRSEPPQDVIVISRTTLGYMVFAFILFLGAYVAGWVMGTQSGEAASVVRTAVKEAVATTIAQLPGSGDSVAAAQPQQPPTQDPNQRFSVSIENNPTIGPDNAPVTIIEFSDFQCPFCKRFHDTTLPVLLKKYEGKIRFAYRDFPISSIHPYAQGAAEAAECAYAQNKFWDYHDLLFQDQQRLTADDLLTYAKQLKLDMTAFKDCLDSRKYAQEVQSDYQAGLTLSINGTPTFFVNGRMLVGAQPLEVFTSYIDAELAAANASVTATPKAAS